ncbi:Kiwa anti-phage protein KwaB-like domain-containing protein [Carnobacterium maltaromaticum]|uniref:Kiwa anti-phage protein KwaB-like domain-containing protein n=1 Tax=Carnobacterium maltaromaticum TaxID=2751 RepID=UPI00191BC92A|nr:Kiwa anti-phage protein KwaB-like domain-containing protein [Carnobacterium maltaromaticum]CAD5896400.1 hypothetical protein CMALT394_100003 [Carnobacterium maltaromaticum]
MKFEYEEILQKLDCTTIPTIKMYFQTSNNIQTTIYEGNLEESASKILFENIIDFFNIQPIPFDNQKTYDFKGKKEDASIEILNLEDFEIMNSIIQHTTRATQDLTNLDFKKITSYIINLEFEDGESLYLFTAFQKGMYLDLNKKKFFKLDGDSLKEAILENNLISIPKTFDICVYKNTVFFNNHSQQVLNKIIDFNVFYNSTIDKTISLIKDANIFSDINAFQIAIESKKDNKIIQNKLARLYVTKKDSFTELTKMHSDQVGKFRENFYKLKEETNLTFSLDENNKIKIDTNNNEELLSLLSFLIDAYGKTFMLGNITED